MHTTGPTYTLNMTFPADYPDEQALTDYITQNRDGFVNVAQSPGARDQPYQMEATTEQHSSGQPPHNTRSVVLKLFQDLGGSHPSTWYKAFNYNLGTKQPITFDNSVRARHHAAGQHLPARPARPGTVRTPWAQRYCPRRASTRRTTRTSPSPTIS